MKVHGAVSLGVASIVTAGLVIVQLVTAQGTKFAAEARTMADVTSTFGGTWKLKQRINPDGTPYGSKLEGVTYISVKSKNGDLLGPHAVATVYAKESGVADAHFFDYPKDVVGKPFQMESTGTWLIHNIANAESGTQVSARVFTMAKGNLQPYTNGMVVNADIHYNVTRTAARAGAAATPRLEFAVLNAGELTDFSGKRIQPGALTGACCGMTSLALTQDTMNITWNNKGKDVWVKSGAAVPAAFR